MHLPRYTLKTSPKMTYFEFISKGPKGDILKIVEFQETNLKDFYNLAFGDKDIVSGEISDTTVSNNGDTEMVLATVVSALYEFTNRNPDVWVYASGSTKTRTRLYRMGINKFLDEILSDFNLFGELGEDWVEFEKSIDFSGFIVKRK